MNQTLLIELLTEELPPKALGRLGAAFSGAIFDELAKLGFAAKDAECATFASPRRLAISIPAVAAIQPDQQIEKKGPAVLAGFKDGQPTPALLGFARSCGLAADQLDKLEKMSDGKQEVFVYRSVKQGEPLTGRLTPPPGANFECVLLPDDDSLYVIASDAGYGFVVKGEDLQAKNKAGKGLLSLPNGAKVMTPRPVADREQDWLAAVTTEGRLLLFPVRDLPQLGKGKGNKIIGIPGERVASREEYLTDLAVLPSGASLVLQAGKRTLTLKADDLEHYKGERGRRGNKLPRGFQRVDQLLVE